VSLRGQPIKTSQTVFRHLRAKAMEYTRHLIASGILGFVELAELPAALNDPDD
jgi:hypothetical protein